MYTHKHSLILSLIILTVGLIVSGFIIAAPLYAQEDTIVFPVAELGNCESEQECKSYCDDPTNMRACITFAKEHNLMTDKEVELAEKFSDSLEMGGGPGDCASPSE